MNGIMNSETIPYQISDTILIDIMLNYLKKCFPIKRIKNKKDKNFKRAIIVNPNEVYYLCNGNETIKLRFITILMNIFFCNKNDANIVVSKYFS